MRSLSSSAEPTPGTWIRMRSAPWRWMVGSRVPTSSMRRRMISRLWRTVRSSLASFSASREPNHDRRIAAADLDVAFADAGQRDDRLRQPAHDLERARHRRRGWRCARAARRAARARADDEAHGVALGAQGVAHVGPVALHPVVIDVFDLDLGQEVRAAAQVEPEVDEPGGHPARPELPRRPRSSGVALLGFRRRRSASLCALDPPVEEVGQGKPDAESHEAPDDHTGPESEGVASRLRRFGLAQHLGDGRAHHADADALGDLDLELAVCP